jgi:hypothetical protein
MIKVSSKEVDYNVLGFYSILMLTISSYPFFFVEIEKYSLVFQHFFIFIMVSFFYLKQSRGAIKKVKYRHANNWADFKKSKSSIVYLAVALSILFSYALIVHPWYLSSEYRMDFFDFIGPYRRLVLLLTVMISVIPVYYVLTGKSFLRAVPYYILLSLIYGSKSGFIFFIVHAFMILDLKVKKYSFYDYSHLMLLGFLGVLVAFLMIYLLSIGEGVGLFEAISNRGSSDIMGIAKVMEGASSQCKDFNILAPVYLFLSKFGFQAGEFHTSLGNCLANPLTYDYKYELLVPLFFELDYLFGSWGVVVIIILFVLHYYLIEFLIKALLLLKRNFFVISLIFYRYYSAIAILLGGKFFNWFVSEYITIAFFVFILLMFKLLPCKSVAAKRFIFK